MCGKKSGDPMNYGSTAREAESRVSGGAPTMKKVSPPLSEILRVEGDLSAREFFQKMLDGMKRTGMRDAHILLPVDQPTLVHVRLLISTGDDTVPPESLDDAMHVISFVDELLKKQRRPAPDQYERRAFDV